MKFYTNALNKNIFKTSAVTGMSNETAKAISKTLSRILACSKNECELKDIVTTPCNTLFKYKINDYGTMYSRIKKLEKEIPVFLECPEVSINYLPKECGFGINIPNMERPLIPLGNLLVSKEYLANKTDTTFAFGIDDQNKIAMMDFNKVPHMLVSGTTGSGKSTFLNAMICSIMANARMNSVKFILVDPKITEFSKFKECTNFLNQPIITSKRDTIRMLWDLVDEMEDRFHTLERNHVSNITEYNILKAPLNEIMPHIVVVIDELGDIMLTNKKEVEPRLARLAQKGRAAGISLCCATQRPDSTIFTGLLKANFPMKVCFKVPSAINSRVALDVNGAEKLLGSGDGLFTNLSTCGLTRFQGVYVSNEEIDKLVHYIQNDALHN